jgi:hypothetical protein
VQVELTPDELEGVAGRAVGIEASSGVCGRFPVEEDDVELRGVGERGRLDDRLELGRRAEDNRRADAVGLGDRFLDPGGQRLHGRTRAKEHVAALDVRRDVLEPELGLQERAQPGHRDAVASADVDAAHEGDESTRTAHPGEAVFHAAALESCPCTV